MAQQTILVVNDDPRLFELIGTALEAQGYDVETAVGGEALAVAVRARPALILLDLVMPGMGGVTVCGHVRADPTTAAIPIVVMAEAQHLDSIVPLMAADGALRKPINLGELHAVVGRWVPRDR